MIEEPRNDTGTETPMILRTVQEGTRELFQHYIDLDPEHTQSLVHVCCRVHPLIRDSASVTTVPFHVEWSRDISGNHRYSLKAAGTVTGSVLAVLGACVTDLYALYAQTSASGNVTGASRKGDIYVSFGLLCVTLVVMARAPLRCAISFFDHLVIYIFSLSPPSPKQMYRGTDAWDPLPGQDPNPCSERSPFKDCKIRTSIVAIEPVDNNLLSRKKKLNSERLIQLFRDDSSTHEVHTQLQTACNPYAIRESAEDHWWQEGIKITTPVLSSRPRTGEIDEVMSLNAVTVRLPAELASVYDDYVRSGDLRVAADRIRDVNLPRDSGEWLNSWHNCWEESSPLAEDIFGKKRLRKDKKVVKTLLRGCTGSKLDHNRWGPLLSDLEMKMCVLNQNGEGALLLPQKLLSTILPRYGHETSVSEVAYLSAKAAAGKCRYFRPKAYVFWLMGAVTIKASTWMGGYVGASAYTLAILFGILSAWFIIMRLAFDFDAQAWATGRVKEGCILESAGGCMVTTAVLLKWNENIRKECSQILASARGASFKAWQSDTVNFRTYMLAGGLLVSTDSAETGLAIFPGSNNLRVRKMKFYENVFRTEDEPVKKNFVLKAKHIISRSHCRVCLESFSARVAPDVNVQT